jgi:hypothetical protein
MTSLVGQTVSRHKIPEHIGHGGMGQVFKAGDLSVRRTVPQVSPRTS